MTLRCSPWHFSSVIDSSESTVHEFYEHRLVTFGVCFEPFLSLESIFAITICIKASARRSSKGNIYGLQSSVHVLKMIQFLLQNSRPIIPAQWFNALRMLPHTRWSKWTLKSLSILLHSSRCSHCILHRAKCFHEGNSQISSLSASVGSLKLRKCVGNLPIVGIFPIVFIQISSAINHERGT